MRMIICSALFFAALLLFGPQSLKAQSLVPLGTLQPELSSRVHSTTGSTEIELPLDRRRCAHILIIPAPAVDARMIERAPRQFASNMPKLEGWQACCRDRRDSVLSRLAPPDGGPLDRNVDPGIILPPSKIRP